jgi:aerobic carbon-monoxide dehydrogenase medium subunit
VLSGLDDPKPRSWPRAEPDAPVSLQLSQPQHIVDLNAAGDLSGIDRDGDVLTIGAMCRQRAAERSADVAAAVPLVVEAL